jgi:hypothetical protein
MKMLHHSFAALVFASSVAYTALSALTPHHAFAGPLDCTGKEGVAKARCERHDKMFAKCGPIKGEAHHACDREFLIANPLDCKALSGKAKQMCETEVKAFKTCEPQLGREFAKCVKAATGESPMGH